MEQNEVSFMGYNTHWILGIRNYDKNFQRLDWFHANSNLVALFVEELQNQFSPQNTSSVIASTSKLYPIRDYVLGKVDNQLQDSVEDLVREKANEGAFDEKVSRYSVIYDRESILNLDSYSPTMLTLDLRRQAHIEYYILPVKLIMSSETSAGVDRLKAIFSNVKKINFLISMFESSFLLQEIKAVVKEKITLFPVVPGVSLRSCLITLKDRENRS